MKYIRTYEKLRNSVDLFYLLPIKNFKESLYKTDIPIKLRLLDEIDNILKDKLKDNKYIYVGIYSEKPSPEPEYDFSWEWMPLMDVDSDDNVIDGEVEFYNDNYEFAGYDNLTPEEIQEVKEIKDLIKIKQNAKKYNL